MEMERDMEQDTERRRAEGGEGSSLPGVRRRTRPRSRGRGAPCGPRSRSRARSRSSQLGAARVKRERDDQCRRGSEERRHSHPPEQEPRRDGSGDRDRHSEHPDRKKNPRDGPGARGSERDTQNLRRQQAQREFDERRRERRQGTGGSGDQSESKATEKAAANKERPSLELSGALLEDTNTFRGVVIAYSEPPEARIPRTRWRLYPFRKDELLAVLYTHRQSAHLLGRHRSADIPIEHPSCSQRHAVLQYRLVEHSPAGGTEGGTVRPCIIDLGSANGTFLNNLRIQPRHYYRLRDKDVLRFGFSSREYVLLHESSDKSEPDAKDNDEDEEEE